jgi:hypothetical protein
MTEQQIEKLDNVIELKTVFIKYQSFNGIEMYLILQTNASKEQITKSYNKIFLNNENDLKDDNQKIYNFVNVLCSENEGVVCFNGNVYR